MSETLPCGQSKMASSPQHIAGCATCRNALQELLIGGGDEY